MTVSGSQPGEVRDPGPAVAGDLPRGDIPPLLGDRSRIRDRRRGERFLHGITAAATLFGAAALVVLLLDVWVDGFSYLSGHFFTNYASRFPERAGIRAPLFGTFWLMGLTALISVPVSVGAAVYLEEYAPRTWISRLLRANVANLAGVPSILYGILGLALFVRSLGLGRSVLAGALTLSLLVVPLIIVAAQRALRAVPKEVRLASYGLGATRWQVVRHHVLPLAWPGILSGAILGVSRAVGEAAPILLIGVLTFVAFTPETPGDPFTALPLQIFSWVTRGEEFRGLAAGAIIVLLAIVFLMNVLAMTIRRRYGRRVQ